MTRRKSGGAGVSSNGRFGVFDFNVEDERVPEEAARLSAKFATRKKKKRNLFSPNEPAVMDVSDNEETGYGYETSVVSTSASSGEDHSNMEVVLYPDYIVFGDMYMTNSVLSFSRTCIRVQGSAWNEIKSDFKSEWSIDDVIKIKSGWQQMVETAAVYMDLKSVVSSGAGDADESTGVDKLKCSVYDPDWSQALEAIKSLDVRYGNIIYPKGDPDAVSVSKRDVELLQPDTFINDTIVDFYLKYLKAKVKPEDQHRFHFFNCFFFLKLADMDKGQSSSCDSSAAFQRVRKWTRNVDLLIGLSSIPSIPFNYHLVDDGSDESSKVPCILHMDSIRGSHKGLKNIFQSYLYEEWKERCNETEDDVSSKFLNLRFVTLELPQQENSSDCGLFLLHYVELFLEEAPINFSPFKITSLSNFLNRDWFLPEEASLKRTQIHNLICDIFREQSQTDLSMDYTDNYNLSQCPDANELETGVVEIIEEKTYCSPITCQGHSSFDTELGILSAASPLLNSRGLFEPQTIARSFPEGNFCQTGVRNWNTSMSPILEVEETGQQLSASTSGTENRWKIAGLAPDTPTVSYYGTDDTSFETSWGPNYMQLEKHYDGDDDDDDDNDDDDDDDGSSKSSEIGLDEEHGGFEHCNGTYEQKSSPTSTEELANCVVEDSEEANPDSNGQRDKDFLSPNVGGNDDFQGTSVNNFDSTEKLLDNGNIQIIDLDLLPDEPIGNGNIEAIHRDRD
ncbi:hypothetical protein Tsubulata_046878, partial [Turnera subulata]